MEQGEEEKGQKRQRAMKSTVSIINVHNQYVRELLLSSKTIERIHN